MSSGEPTSNHDPSGERWHEVTSSARRHDGRAGNIPIIVGVVALAMLVLTPVTIFAVTVSGRILGESPSLPDASTVARRYLEAIANSDAEAALRYLDQEPPDTSLMTKRVLEVSNKLAPITDIKIGKSQRNTGNHDDAKSIDASYRVGSQAVQTTITVHRPAHGYVVKDGYAKSPVNPQIRTAQITVNKKPFSGKYAYLFPGAYIVEPTNKYLEFAASARFMIYSSDRYEGRGLVHLRLSLNHAGEELFRKKVTESIKTCAASKKLKAGCGLNLAPTTRRGFRLKNGTVNRELDAETWSTIKRAKLTGMAVIDGDVARVKSKSDLLAEIPTYATMTRWGHTSKHRRVLTGDGAFLGDPWLDLTDKKPRVRWR